MTTRPANLLDLFVGTRGAVPYVPAQVHLKAHTIDYVEDRVGNGDEVYKGIVDFHDRRPYHGYNPGEDEAAYNASQIDLVQNIQNARKAVAERWQKTAEATSEEGFSANEALSKFAPALGQIVGKY